MKKVVFKVNGVAIAQDDLDYDDLKVDEVIGLTIEEKLVMFKIAKTYRCFDRKLVGNVWISFEYTSIELQAI